MTDIIEVASGHVEVSGSTSSTVTPASGDGVVEVGGSGATLDIDGDAEVITSGGGTTVVTTGTTAIQIVEAATARSK